MLRRLVAAVVVVAVSAPVYAERVVAVAPLSTLGAEDKSATTKKILAQIEQAVASLGDKVIPAAQVTAAIDKAKKPQLKACEGDAACLGELGKLVGANVVISGEVGGLGDSKVIYLGATDVATAKEMRSTTLTLTAKETAGSDNGGAQGAAIRLLDPDKYRGSIHFAVDVSGATIFINGAKVTPGPKGDVALPVGMQAVRVTHPEYHDFIKFIDVTYGKTTEVPVPLQQYPIVEHDVKAKPTSLDKVLIVEPPLWRRWYVAGPAIAVVAVGIGILAGVIANRYPKYDDCRMLGSNGC
ncbi:MAG: PEGA domain-containing protein [Deltaproteobacteria bacterium]